MAMLSRGYGGRMGILRAKQPANIDLLRGMVAKIVEILFMVSTVQIK